MHLATGVETMIRYVSSGQQSPIFYALTQNPQVEQRMLAESAVLGDRTPTQERL